MEFTSDSFTSIYASMLYDSHMMQPVPTGQQAPCQSSHADQSYYVQVINHTRYKCSYHVIDLFVVPWNPRTLQWIHAGSNNIAPETKSNLSIHTHGGHVVRTYRHACAHSESDSIESHAQAGALVCKHAQPRYAIKISQHSGQSTG